jgi:glutaredoxin 3
MYCLKTQNILDKKKIKYQTIDLSNNHNLHMELLQQTGQTTVPYIFINNNFIGGFQDLKNLEQQEKL